MQQLIADLLKRCEMCETHRDLYGETKCMAYVSVDLCGVSFEVAGWSASVGRDHRCLNRVDVPRQPEH